MKILLSRGIPTNRITFIPTFRDPLDTLASWKFMWNWDWDNFPFKSFNKSFQTVAGKIESSINLGINVVPYVHEFIRDFDCFTVIKRMCKLAKIPFSPKMVQWEESYNTDGKSDPYFDGNIVKYDQPPDRWIRGVLSPEHGGRGGLIWKPISPKLELSNEEICFVTKQIQPALEIHEHYVSVAKKLLGL
jgi:hypothetical protein